MYIPVYFGNVRKFTNMCIIILPKGIQEDEEHIHLVGRHEVQVRFEVFVLLKSVLMKFKMCIMVTPLV